MAYNGRDMTVDFNSTTLVGVRNKGVSINNSPVDVTSDDDDGWQKLLAEPGKRTVEVSVSGVTEDEVLMAEVMTGAGSFTLKSGVVNLATGSGTLTSNWFVSTLEHTGEHDGALEFSATLMSSGAVTYSASA